MSTWQFWGIVIGVTAVSVAAIWVIARAVARWLMADWIERRRAARRHKGNGRN
jgi:uncharacterized oligopeptide transporter (OPT) family protein